MAEVSHLFADIVPPADLGEAFIRNLTQFWINCAALRGAKFKVGAMRDRDAAIARVRGR